MKKIETKYFMVRAMHQTKKDFEVFFKNNVIAVGWSKVDFTQFSDIEELIKEIEKIYYSDSKTIPQVIGKRKNEVRRFKGINNGDRILVPYYNSIRLAVASGQGIYNVKLKDSLDLSNQHKVEYLCTGDDIISIPRIDLTEGLQRRLRVQGATVADLYEFKDRIEEIFSSKSFKWISSVDKIQNNIIAKFKLQLLNNICDGKTYLQSGGRGLENLIKELMEIEGYTANILPNRVFNGIADADIKAVKPDRFEEIRVLIQVKHHQGTSDTWGAEQLEDIRRRYPYTYSEYKLVLITTAKSSKELLNFCDKKGFILISGEDLIDWIFDSMPKLKPDTKKKLGISDIPQFLL